MHSLKLHYPHFKCSVATVVKCLPIAWLHIQDISVTAENSLDRAQLNSSVYLEEYINISIEVLVMIFK